MHKIRTIVLGIVSLFMFAALTPALSPSAAAATVCPAGQSQASCDACAGITAAGGDCGSSTDSLDQVLKNIINLVSAIVGVVAVVMVIVSGFKYITSSGDSNKIASAKSTLIYAIIGLVIVALAQIIVHFVISEVKPTAVDPAATPAAMVLYTNRLV